MSLDVAVTTISNAKIEMQQQCDSIFYALTLENEPLTYTKDMS